MLICATFHFASFEKGERSCATQNVPKDLIRYLYFSFISRVFDYWMTWLLENYETSNFLQNDFRVQVPSKESNPLLRSSST